MTENSRDAPSSSPESIDEHSPPSDQPIAGRGILRTTVAGTGLFSVLGVTAAALQGPVTGVYVAVSLGEFFIGIAVFVLAFLRAVDRSRTEAIGIGGLFFASGSTPKRVQVIFMATLSVQVVVAVVVAATQPYTGLAFGVLAPMWTFGFTGLWVAAYGEFPVRVAEPTMAARREAARKAHRDSAPKNASDSAE